MSNQTPLDLWIKRLKWTTGQCTPPPSRHPPTHPPPSYYSNDNCLNWFALSQKLAGTLCGWSEPDTTPLQKHNQGRLNISAHDDRGSLQKPNAPSAAHPLASTTRRNRFSQVHLTRGLQRLLKSKVSSCTARNILIKLYWQNMDNYILLGSILCVKIVANLTQTQKL